MSSIECVISGLLPSVRLMNFQRKLLNNGNSSLELIVDVGQIHTFKYLLAFHESGNF